MEEVIDLCCSSDESWAGAPKRKREDVVLSSDSSESEIVDLTQRKAQEEDESSLLSSEPESECESFEAAMRRAPEEREASPKKQKTSSRLPESEKKRRAEKRREARELAKVAKRAKLAEGQAALSKTVDAEVSPDAGFCRAYPVVVALLKDRGWSVVPKDYETPLPSVGVAATSGKRRQARTILVVDATRAAPTDMKATVVKAALSSLTPKDDEITVALLGAARAATLPDVAFLETKFTLRCLIPPRVGRDQNAKASAKLTELVTSYGTCLVDLVKNHQRRAPGTDSQNDDDDDDDENDDDDFPPQQNNAGGHHGGRGHVRANVVAAADDLLSGLDVKDVCKWTGAKPKSNTVAWPTFLRVVLPPNAADVVAEAYPSFTRLHNALRRQGPAAVSELTLPTPARPRLGPALATKLHTFLTATDPRTTL
mmetsp:Transcript_32720/g.104298  ORF Transcript_32720/g.104298 Transcript_32720/m.104298 type:complete len:427 (+) Transcript_32720:14-1294(+)